MAPPRAQPGDAQLGAARTVLPQISQRAYDYFQHGGAANMQHLLRYLANSALGATYDVEPARELAWEGIYHPELGGETTLEALTQRWRPERPNVGIVFYRAHWMSGNLDWLDSLVHALE